jgi:hypothetical protein
MAETEKFILKFLDFQGTCIAKTFFKKNNNKVGRLIVSDFKTD